jgi:hypothetical protein
MDQDKYLKAKWTPTPQEPEGAFLENRVRIHSWVSGQWAEKMNTEYGPFDPKGDILPYAPKDMGDAVDGTSRAPLTTDLVAFVVWLRENSDFFSGPNLDQHFPSANDPSFHEVLSHLALLYTEE